ncbi:basic leucine zipper and W2 domain-containing protein 1 [Striga asiatica]|uniref:Basic leucine zipper and W2 domain-containing protein 1 n=1 Tax=Striga asiatica TaxID=4170 RepID=A0A5A7RFU6_STRAF|nr:basic leucine zipper and W2 domain-containing protein 1 [Striga asiatica]
MEVLDTSQKLEHETFNFTLTKWLLHGLHQCLKIVFHVLHDHKDAVKIAPHNYFFDIHNGGRNNFSSPLILGPIYNPIRSFIYLVESLKLIDTPATLKHINTPLLGLWGIRGTTRTTIIIGICLRKASFIIGMITVLIYFHIFVIVIFFTITISTGGPNTSIRPTGPLFSPHGAFSFDLSNLRTY